MIALCAVNGLVLIEDHEEVQARLGRMGQRSARSARFLQHPGREESWDTFWYMVDRYGQGTVLRDQEMALDEWIRLSIGGSVATGAGARSDPCYIQQSYDCDRSCERLAVILEQIHEARMKSDLAYPYKRIR